MKGWDHHQLYVFPHVLREEHSAQDVQQEHAADTYDLYCFILQHDFTLPHSMPPHRMCMMHMLAIFHRKLNEAQHHQENKEKTQTYKHPAYGIGILRLVRSVTS